MKTFPFYYLSILLLCSCALSKQNGAQKFSPDQLQKDYSLFQDILEESHPGLYWYTPKDSMDFYFDKGRNMLSDSLTEPRFRNVLSYVLAKINCGHTVARSSKAYENANDSMRRRQFPLGLKIWKDTAVVTQNLNRKDSFITRGSLLTAIDGRPVQSIVDSLFQYLSADGNNLTHKYQSLSNRGVFSNLYLSVFGYKPSFHVEFIDTLGRRGNSRIFIYKPPADTSNKKKQAQKTARITKRERRKLVRNNLRSLSIDSALSTAFINLNTFTNNGKLRRFFRSSFKKIEIENLQNVVLDLRGNGGGSVTNSNLLTKYIIKKPFRIADSLYAIKLNSEYGRYQQHRIFNWLFMVFMTRKGSDGAHHFRFYERKYFKPRNNNHFDGQVYILSGGNTFSASTLFIKSVKDQDNVIVVGEETGGGAYGNNAWLIPDVTLPLTKLRFRLPLFRLVIDKNEKKGNGVMPDLESLPTVEAIRRQADFKKEKTIELIKGNR